MGTVRGRWNLPWDESAWTAHGLPAARTGGQAPKPAVVALIFPGAVKMIICDTAGYG
jgi:hypothetical protein